MRRSILVTILSLTLAGIASAQYVWGPTTLVNLTAPVGKVKVVPNSPDIVWALTVNVPDPTSTAAPAGGILEEYRSGGHLDADE